MVYCFYDVGSHNFCLNYSGLIHLKKKRASSKCKIENSPSLRSEERLKDQDAMLMSNDNLLTLSSGKCPNWGFGRPMPSRVLVIFSNPVEGAIQK